ncbi:MAG: hypothetical protein AB1679_06905 [Actinomycetota bacterium]|jgi:hypothetical protein
MTATTDQTRAVPVAINAPKTLRRDRWWVAPLITVVVLGAFTIYGTWAAFADTNYFADPYLSPFYSPCLATSCDHATIELFGDWFQLSPALLILPFPLGFRLTCYYYRKAYYRAFFWSPPACAVPDAPRRYSGESRFPLILQNVHRLFFYLVLPFPILLLWDALRAFDFPDGFGMGVGTLILLANAILLATYVLSCHSCRHVCGGRIDCLSENSARYGVWKFVTRLNERHMLIAWISLVGVAATDLYIRLVANGTIRDLRFF